MYLRTRHHRCEADEIHSHCHGREGSVSTARSEKTHIVYHGKNPLLQFRYRNETDSRALYIIRSHHTARGTRTFRQTLQPQNVDPIGWRTVKQSRTRQSANQFV